MNIYLLIGLPGSGKTRYLEQNIEKDQSTYIFDDMSQIQLGMDTLKTKISDKTTKKIYISDVNFCEERILNMAIKKIKGLNQDIDIHFSFIVFHSNQDIAKNNVEYRNDGRYVLPTIRRFAPELPKTIQYLNDNINKADIEHIQTPLMKKTANIKP